MPWTIADVDSHKKGLSAAQKKRWVAIANSALARCQKNNGSNCEGGAIRQANSAATKYAETEAEEERAYWFAEQGTTESILLVALWLPEDVAKELAVPNGESADNLHMSLAVYDATEFGVLDEARIVAAVDNAVRWRPPLEGQISGYGRFHNDQDVFYATANIDGLTEIRQSIVQYVAEAGYIPQTDFDFTPHITLSYLESGADNPVDSVPTLDLTFGCVYVSNAAKEMIDIPFYTPTEAHMTETVYVDVPVVTPDGIVYDVRPLLFSADQEWIAFLPKPGTYHHRRYGNLNLNTEKYTRIVDNFHNKDVFDQDLPVTIEHDSHATGAVGWLRDMRIASDGSIEVKPEWNNRGKSLLDDDRFRYVSAEFVPRWQHPTTGEWYDDVAVGHTICVRPHFKRDALQPLAASEDIALIMAGAAESAPVPAQEIIHMSDAQVTPKEEDKSPPEEAKITLVDGSPSGFLDVVALAEERNRLRRQFDDMETRVKLAETARDDAVADKDQLLRERRVEKYTAEVLGRSEHNGLRWLGDPKRHIEVLVSLSEKHGDNSAEVRYIIEEQRSKRQAVESSGAFREIGISQGTTGATVMDDVNKAAQVYMESDSTLTREQAVVKVFSEHPDWYDRSTEG